MHLTDLQKKKHLFKRRGKKKLSKKLLIPYGNLGLYNLKQTRYELVYLRFLKKVFRQRHIRRKVSFLKKKFWFFLRPNYILSIKSTNSRMGAGVGSLVRVAINLKAYKVFAATKGYSVFWLLTLYKKLRFKYPFYFLVCNRRHC